MIAKFLGGNVLLVGLISAAVVAVLGWDSSRKASWVETGRKEIVQASKEKGAANAAEAEKAHDTARKPGAVERLRKDARACPDCPR